MDTTVTFATRSSRNQWHSIDDLSIMVIERMKNEDPDLRKKRESYWIHHLQSLSPAGMNLDP